MSTLIEAAQQALELLERVMSHGQAVQEAKNILRRAIEQAQKQEPVAGQPLPCPFCGHVGLDFSDGNTYRWGIASCGGCGASCGDIRREYPDEGKWHSEAIAEWNKRTSPPPRQPLTDEEAHQTLLDMSAHIESFGDENTTEQQLAAECIRFIVGRVTAHGIKGEA
jgi:transcription elongation factor Elf1